MKQYRYERLLGFSKNLFRSLARTAASALVSMCGTVTLFVLIGSSLQPLHAQMTTEVVWQRCIGGSSVEYASELKELSDGGFIALGRSASTNGDAIGAHGAEDILIAKVNATGNVQWSRALGGAENELGITCLEASDGSIVIAGITLSSDGDVSANHGEWDFWVCKLSPQGDLLWQRTYGGSSSEISVEWIDRGHHLRETTDGGFIVHCETFSGDGDVAGFHPGNNTLDAWVFKISASGDLLWSRALGGSDMEKLGRSIPLADGGSAYCIHTLSNDGDVVGYHGAWDLLVVKLDVSGQVQWTHTVGGSMEEFCHGLHELPSGELVVFGSTSSNDGDIAINHGSSDMLLAKLSSNGSLLWTKTYGGSLNEECRSLLPIADGSFLLGGTSGSSDGDATDNQGEEDAWVVSVAADGTLLWQRSFGGSLTEAAVLEQGLFGGYLLSGISVSNNGDVQGGHGSVDLWLVKLSNAGDLLWQRCLGGSDSEYGFLKAQTADGGYVVFGDTHSNDGDVSGNHGDQDMWVVKLKVTDPIEPLECALYIPNAFSPNASGKNDSQCMYGADCITSMQLGIFDRWGNKVFESTNPNACWDGTYNGQALDPAVFVYHLSATMNNGEQVERQGNITLVR